MPTKEQIRRRHLAEFRLSHAARDPQPQEKGDNSDDNVLGYITFDKEERELTFTPKPTEDADSKGNG